MCRRRRTIASCNHYTQLVLLGRFGDVSVAASCRLQCLVVDVPELMQFCSFFQTVSNVILLHEHEHLVYPVFRSIECSRHFRRATRTKCIVYKRKTARNHTLLVTTRSKPRTQSIKQTKTLARRHSIITGEHIP